MRISRSIRFLLVAVLMLLLSAVASAGVVIAVSFGPPALPIYEQPFCPGPDFIWVPGYWAWSPIGYYWVPGTWLLAPEPGLLWTPGYWAFDDGLFYWHAGYWAPVVGYYGGIVYGFGYTGTGYYGGYWRDNHFYYNQNVTNVNITNVRYVYNQPVTSVTTVTRVSYNGGPGGTTARPTAEQIAATRQRQVMPTSAQMKHEEAASKNREFLATENQGRPPVAATAKPADFKGHGIVAASAAGAPFRPPEHAASPQNNTAPVQGNPPAMPQENRKQKQENKVQVPENRPQVNTVRPEIEQPRTPSHTVTPPPPPNASEKENMRRMETAPHPQKEVRPESAPHPGKEPPPNKQARPEKSAPPEKESHPNHGEEERPH